MARILAVLTMAATGIASTYAASIGINPGDVLLSSGAVVGIGLLPGVSPTYSPTGKGASNLASGNTDGITVNTGVGSGVGQGGATGTGAYTAVGKGFTQTNLSNAVPIGSPTIGASTNNNAGAGFTGLPDYKPGNPACTSVNCQQTIYTPPSGPVFDLLGDGTSTTTSNAWVSLSTGNTATTEAQITIPIGIFGVTSISTMLNTYGGITTTGQFCANGAAVGTNNCTAANGAFSTISFEFNATDPTGQTGTNIYETFALINGVTQRNILDGAQTGGTFTNNLCTTSNNILSTTSVTASCSYSTTDSNGNAATIQVGNLWNGAVNSTQNTMVLDYQIFPVLTPYLGSYLVSAQITDFGTGTTTSREVLSGLSVTTTPEPSTILMVFAGFAGLGISRLRRKSS